MAEGIVPAIRREDPLLPDTVTGVTAAQRLNFQHRELQLTIAAGGRHRVLTFPRGSLRGGAEKVPSRWLLPTLNALTGAAVSTTGWRRDTERCERVVTIESFDAATQRCDARVGVGAASATEWRLRALAAVPARQRRRSLPDPVIARGMEMRGDRLWGRFTRFNGNLADATELIRVFDDPVAPTRLEDWVASPYVFFVQQVLGVRLLEDPDDVTQIDPLSRGTVVHTVLERYVEELIAGAEGTPDRLLQITSDVLAQASANAPGWLPQLWERDRTLISHDLAQWFGYDRDDRAAGWAPVGAETGFGDTDEPPLVFDVGEARLRFRGKVDRIDRHRDGSLRVTDYKTGKTDRYLNQSAAAPTAGCTRFQLPVYGLFARTLTQGGRVDARYWFTSTKGKFEEIGYEITDTVLATLRADLAFVYRSITSGQFPPKPGGRFDDMTTLLGREGMQRSWQALLGVPELAEFVAIHTAETESS
ncbi:RecB family exonuclease [Rhodococcus sp. NPDC019627]|uniref:PD-(D/E)XK nuclease family protein n=1 Tax=unclassified Rhodococcus (in: high G+C Gram-positive bacteria) TaxID=192944 RepID=UPI0033C3E356